MQKSDDYDEEIKENLQRHEVIKQQIFKAFADVKLGDGIGFYEAGAIDDRLLPTDPSYIEEKARDERDDWRKVFAKLEDKANFDSYRHCFMDAKGLHFYLPIILLLCDSVAQDSVLMHGVIKNTPNNIELMKLLTSEQKQSILDCLEDSVDYEASVNYFINFKGPICHSCGKIHYPTSYSKEEAIAEVEGEDNYILFQFLKEYFKKLV
jgi:hypothetical protein